MGAEISKIRFNLKMKGGGGEKTHRHLKSSHSRAFSFQWAQS